MKLLDNFELEKYGVHVRLVNEGDAEFILRLRTDTQLSRFIHSTDNDLEKQIKWIREYKKREQQGLDYYFIFSYNGVPIGLNRICDICDDHATGASLVCEKGLLLELPVIIILINREIFFEILNIPLDVFDVRIGNKKVQKLHKLFGAKFVREDELNYYYTLSKADYLSNKAYMLKLLDLK